MVAGDRLVDRDPQRSQLAVHGVQGGVVDCDLVDRRPVQVDELEGVGSSSGASSDEQRIDLEGEERREGVLLRGSLAGLVVRDHQSPVRGLLHAVEDSPDHDPVEVFEHVELAVERFDERGVFHREVVGEQGQALQTPGSLVLHTGEQPVEFGGAHLGPSLAEQVVEPLRGALGGREVVEPLQGEVGGGPARLIDRGRLREPVYGTELEELGAVFEVTRPARGQGLQRHSPDYTGRE